MDVEVEEREVIEVIEVQEDPQPLAEDPRPPETIGTVVEWRPVPSTSLRIGLAVMGVALACAVAGLVYAVTRPIAIDSYVAAIVGLVGLAVGLFAGVASYGYRSMRYTLSSQALTIRWLWIRHVVPLGRIEGIFGGHRLGKRVRVWGFSWPGQYSGWTRAEELGRLNFHGTSLDPSNAMIVATANAGYAITPADLDGFRDQLIERLEAMTAEAVEQAPEPRREAPKWMGLSILVDRLSFGLLFLALLVLLVSFGYVAARFQGLPELMPLHFNYVGEPDLIGPPMDAFRMPLIGLVILVVNGAVAAAVHGWQRAAGRMLLAATVFVQLVMLIAVLRVVH